MRRITDNNENKDFVIRFDTADDNETMVITSEQNLGEERIRRILTSALNEYDPANKRYSASFSDGTPDTSISFARLIELATNAQTNLSNMLVINNLIRLYINVNDIFGVTYEAIESNVNTQYRLMYNDKSVDGKKIKSNKLEKAKKVISAFHEEINLGGLIRTAIPLTFAEGTFIVYLRTTKTKNYVLDYYPLGVAEISDYAINGKPVVVINMSELKTRLKKTYRKKKDQSPLFFNNIKEEIENNYPQEVIDAYNNNESYAVLDYTRTGVIRINNLNRKYGLSPFFRALKPAIMLDNFDDADLITSKAKAKKIIFQKMRKELVGSELLLRGFEEQAYAHQNLLKAFGQATVLYTGTPSVESLEYIEPKSEMTPIDTINAYRNRVMTTLGISFLNTDGATSVTTANISVTQLLFAINKISEKLEVVLKDWYKLVLTEQSLEPEYAPTIKIIDSEQLSMDIKKSLVELLFSKLNCSYQTAFEMVGIDIEDEMERRKTENEADYEEIFRAHPSQYTTPGTPEGGRPPNGETVLDEDKQAYDKERNNAK